jgi:3',5'-cyclic AMP phosphodiesterase CpdA
MRRIVHLSDIHFGSVDAAVVESLASSVNELAPNVVVVSGDLTQRARTREFRLAREFLDKLPSPQIVVPGNHDVPLYNIFQRLAMPLEKFRRHISADLAPTYIDDEIAVAGINTARSLTLKSGRVNRGQIDTIRGKFVHLSSHLVKIIVTHHPFDLPEGTGSGAIVGRAKMAMSELSGCGADLFLAGHLHISGVVDTTKRYQMKDGRSALVIQAGTAASVRGRGEAQSYNVLEIRDRVLTINRMEFTGKNAGFQNVETKRYSRGALGWTSLSS